MVRHHSLSSRSPKKLSVPQVHFLCEQDGPPELLLKGRVAAFFREINTVQRAYLARVTYGDGNNAGVAMCIRAYVGFDEWLVQVVGEIFASIFGAHEHLDIVFLDSAQERELSKICKPFFSTAHGLS